MIKIFLFLLVFPFSIFAQGKMDLFFEFNKDVPNKTSLDNLNYWIKYNPKIEVTIINGYCDSVDVSSYNKDLSKRRINAVLKILENNKISINKNIQINPFGEDFDRSKIQSENRKVTFYFNKILQQEVKKITVESDYIKDERSLMQKFKKAKKDDIIQLFNINFKLNSEEVNPESEQVLLDLFEVLYKYPNLRIEIQGHICCNPNSMDISLSSRRAKFIFDFLIEQGIETGRLNYKGFGSVRPLYKIPEKNEAEKKANRRVEILIVEPI